MQILNCTKRNKLHGLELHTANLQTSIYAILLGTAKNARIMLYIYVTLGTQTGTCNLLQCN